MRSARGYRYRNNVKVRVIVFSMTRIKGGCFVLIFSLVYLEVTIFFAEDVELANHFIVSHNIIGVEVDC